MLLNINKYRILSEFLGDYHGRIYGGEIAKKLKMNQKTVSNVLNELESEHILKFKLEGKNKYYYLNEFYSQIVGIINLIEIQKRIGFFERYKKKRDLFFKLIDRVDGVLVIFGSYASFRANEKSDLDVFVLGKIKSVEDLEELYGLKINVVKSDKKKFDSREHIVKEVIKNHVVLKGVEDFVNLLWLV